MNLITNYVYQSNQSEISTIRIPSSGVPITLINFSKYCFLSITFTIHHLAYIYHLLAEINIFLKMANTNFRLYKLLNFNIIRIFTVVLCPFTIRLGRSKFAIRTGNISSLTVGLAKTQDIDEHLKATNQIRWVQMMSNVRSTAEEPVMSELILA